MTRRTLLHLASGANFWVVLLAFSLAAQQTTPPPSASEPNPIGLPQPKNWTAEEDHQNMMDQLGIKVLRPGPSGNANAPNHANYDESKANSFRDLPDALTFKSGKKVTTAEGWWMQRRPEIVEDFEREVVGRVPKSVPKVIWTIANTETAIVASHPVIKRQLVGT